MFVIICGKIFNKNHILYIRKEIEPVGEGEPIFDRIYQYSIRVVLYTGSESPREVLCSCENEQHMHDEYKRLITQCMLLQA